MDTNKTPETPEEVFELFVQDYKKYNFTTNWYTDFSALLNDNLISSLNILKQKGLVKHLGIGNSWWQLTAYGRNKALELDRVKTHAETHVETDISY